MGCDKQVVPIITKKYVYFQLQKHLLTEKFMIIPFKFHIFNDLSEPPDIMCLLSRDILQQYTLPQYKKK